MLYKTVKKVLSESFSHATKLANVAKNGYELNLSKASTEMEKHMAESARKLIDEGKLAKEAINGDLLKLTGKEAFKVRYNNTSTMKRIDPLMDDMAKIGAVAAAGVIGLKTTQSAISLATGEW